VVPSSLLAVSACFCDISRYRFFTSFAFFLSVAFPTSCMFLANASVNFCLMLSFCGFHVAAHRLFPVRLYLSLATISSFPYFYSPSTPLPAVSEGVFCSFFLCRSHSLCFYCEDIVYNKSANYHWLNVIHCIGISVKSDRPSNG